jgi:hypothetical protein
MFTQLEPGLLQKRNSQIELWKKVPLWASKIYLMTFRKYFEEYTLEVVKIGQTAFYETYDRILYNHAIFKEGKEKEYIKDTMFGYYDEIKVNTSAMLPSGKVDDIEKEVLRLWGPQDLEIPKMNGMSEMRKYSKERYAIASLIIEKNRYVKR